MAAAGGTKRLSGVPETLTLATPAPVGLFGSGFGSHCVVF